MNFLVFFDIFRQLTVCQSVTVFTLHPFFAQQSTRKNQKFWKRIYRTRLKYKRKLFSLKKVEVLFF